MKHPLPIGVVALCIAFVNQSMAIDANRSYDGSGNNLSNPTWGAAGTTLLRIAPSAYDDGVSTPRGTSIVTLPNPRLISNTVVAQPIMMPNTHRMSGWVFQWGQFLDHDLDLTGAASPTESFNIPIPQGDPIFDPMSTGTQVMPFRRSNYDPATGTGMGNPREQINQITSYLDASMVYGSDAARATALRTLSDGMLKTSAGNLLPLNTLGLDNGTGGPMPPELFYVAGDVRANEQVGLTAIHTLFVREHNRLAEQIAAANPGWNDEQIYQYARKIVGAEVQAITFNEFLPAILGIHAPSANNAYDPNLNASVSTEFSTALFRVGHTMLPTELLRIQNDGSPAPGGPLSLRNAFFLPMNLAAGPNELENFLKGLATLRQQQVDIHVVDDVRNFLFGEPIPGGFDLASLNIQRGRDHGLPDYNSLRIAFGLNPVMTFDEITSDAGIQAALQALYGDVNNIDPWIGALAENHLPGAQMGSLLVAGFLDQFTRARDGDRFWFLTDDGLSADDKNRLMSLSLGDVIRANTSITNLQGNVFFVPAVPEPVTTTLGLVSLGALTAYAARRRR